MTSYQPSSDRHRDIAFAELTASCDPQFLWRLPQLLRPADFRFRQMRENSANYGQWVFPERPEWQGANVLLEDGRISHNSFGGEVPQGAHSQELLGLFRRNLPGVEQVNFARLDAGGKIDWHSHHFITVDGQPRELPETSVILHIPIITNDFVRYSVTRSLDPKSGHRPVHQRLPALSVWYFNSWHYHRVVNNGDLPRFTLMIYMDVRSPWFHQAMQEAIENDHFTPI